MNRRSLTNSVRFEVFKRDSFTCQYCGRKAPDVVLEADHIHPVAKGGANDLLNLITSCKDCNSGKSDRELDDSSVVEKQRKQLTELQERKEQIEMMFQWQKGLLGLGDQVVDSLSEFWSELVPFSLTDSGRQELKKALKKYSMEEVMTAMKTAVDQYVEYSDGEQTITSVEKAWNYVSRICFVSKAEKDKPYLRDLLYARGILRKRLTYVNEQLALQLLERAYHLEADIDGLKEYAKTAKNWTEWRSGMEDFIHEQESISSNEEVTVIAPDDDTSDDAQSDGKNIQVEEEITHEENVCQKMGFVETGGCAYKKLDDLDVGEQKQIAASTEAVRISEASKKKHHSHNKRKRRF